MLYSSFLLAKGAQFALSLLRILRQLAAQLGAKILDVVSQCGNAALRGVGFRLHRNVEGVICCHEVPP